MALDHASVLEHPGPASRTRPAAWAQLAQRARPVALAGEQLLPVLPALAPLLPDGALRRGTAVAVAGAGAATSLGLALVAGPSQAGSWVAGVGLTSLGLLAAGELGVALERLVLVAEPPPALWPTVVAALVDAFDAVLLAPPGHLRPGDARRLAARARERGAVLVAMGATGPLAPDVRLTAAAVTWEGAGHGDGHLRARRVEVEATGRGRAARPRRAVLWLPDARGRVRLDEPQVAPRALAPAGAATAGVGVEPGEATAMRQVG